MNWLGFSRKIMFAFVVFLAAAASLRAAPKHIGETDLTAWPPSNTNTAYDKRSEGSYLSAIEKSSEREASINAKFRHTINRFHKIVQKLPVDKRETTMKTLRNIFLKLKNFEMKSAADDGELKKSFKGKKPKELLINESKSIDNSTHIESRHHADNSTPISNIGKHLLDVLASRHLDAKSKQFLQDLLSANKTATHLLTSLPPIHPLMFQFENEGIKREKIKKEKDESEEEDDNDIDKNEEMIKNSADVHENKKSSFPDALIPIGILFEDEVEIPLQTNQDILSVSHMAPTNARNQIQPEKIMHGNINPEIAFNNLLATSMHADENANLFSELTDILGLSEEENESVEKEHGGGGDLTGNTISNQVVLSNAFENPSIDKNKSKHFSKTSVFGQVLHQNSIQKAIQNAIQLEDNHTRNLKRAQNVHQSSGIGPDTNLVANLPKSKMPDTFLASSLQRIHTLDAKSHFKEIPDPENEIKALENLLKLAEGFSGPQNQHPGSFQDQNNLFIPLGDDKMFLQYLQGDGDEEEQESESEEENVSQTNVQNRNVNVLKGNSANGEDEKKSPQWSSHNLIAALFPMEKKPEVSVIKFSGSQNEQEKESSEENSKEKTNIFRHGVLAQSISLESEENGVELDTENSEDSEEASPVVVSGKQEGQHKLNSDIENIVEAMQNLVHIPKNDKTRESSESKERSESSNQRKSESNEQESIRGQDTVTLKSSSKSESHDQDLSTSEGNIKGSSISESNEHDSNDEDSRIPGSNELASVISRSSEQDVSNSESNEIGSSNSESSGQDLSISESNEQDSIISSISNSSDSESIEQDSSNSKSNNKDSSNSALNGQDSSNSDSDEQDSSDENQESKDSESQETQPVLFPPINHLDNIADQLTRIDESKSERKIRKDMKPPVVVRKLKPDTLLPRQSHPKNNIPKDDIVFPKGQPKDDKSYVPNLPEEKRMLNQIPVDTPARETHANWNFDEVDAGLNLVPPITNDDDLFIAIQNIERNLPRDMERHKKQDNYEKKTTNDYSGIIKFSSKYSEIEGNAKLNKDAGYSSSYNDPVFYNTKRTYGGIDKMKYKTILPYAQSSYRNDVGYIEPGFYNRFLPHTDDTSDYRNGHMYKGSIGYRRSSSLYKKSHYNGQTLLNPSPRDLDELNQIYKDSYGYQSPKSWHTKSTYSGHTVLNLSSKELDDLNQIYRATRQYRPTPFAKSRNHYYPVFRGPHRKLNEQTQINGDRSNARLFYSERSLFRRRLFGRRILTRPGRRAFARHRSYGRSRTEHLSKNRDYFFIDLYPRRHR